MIDHGSIGSMYLLGERERERERVGMFVVDESPSSVRHCNCDAGTDMMWNVAIAKRYSLSSSHKFNTTFDDAFMKFFLLRLMMTLLSSTLGEHKT